MKFPSIFFPLSFTCHFKIHSGYFSNFANIFLQTVGSNLSFFTYAARYLTSLESKKNNFSIRQHVLQKRSILVTNDPLGQLCTNWHISNFLCGSVYTTCGGEQYLLSKRNHFWGHYKYQIK